MKLSFVPIVLLAISTCASASDPKATELSSLPIAAQSSISAALGRDLSGYHIRASGSTLETTTSHGALTAQFTPAGIQLISNHLHWTMALRACGYGAAIAPVIQASPQANANRVEYRRGPLTEWYENGPVGLEQGFTLTAPPTKRNGQLLTIALSLSGDLTPKPDESRTGLTLTDRAGKSALRYAGLAARDADGKDLRASLEVQGEELMIHVDDRNAHYPLTVDPLVQLAKLTASDSGYGELFGSSIAIDGNTVVVGAEGATLNGNMFEGAVYVFVKPTGGWANMTQMAKLTASDSFYGSFFGASVSISGNTILATAPSYYGRAAYVFVEPPGGWTDMTETAELTDGTFDDDFGVSSAISGDMIVVGARTTNNQTGAVYIFLRPAGGWATTSGYAAELTASDGISGDLFGSSVATDGKTIIASSPFFNSSEGKAYLFVRPASGWTTTSNFDAKLTASDGAPENFFGYGMSVKGDTVVIGAVSGGNSAQGAAYVYVAPAQGWTTMTQTAELTVPNGDGEALGGSVSIEGRVVVVGANQSISGQGAVFIFREPTGGWVSTSHPYARLTASDGAAGDYFGAASAISGGTIVVGAAYNQVGNYNAGAAYVFGP